VRPLIWVGGLLIVGCDDRAGVLYGPGGTEALRTALYRVGTRDGRPELAILLSNGEIGCAIPDFGASEAYESLLVAACREGARHVVLLAYDVDGEWSGTYPGRDGADGMAPEEHPREVRATYYAVTEAFLYTLDGLDRGYLAFEDQLAQVGDGGELTIELGGGGLSGTFGFPEGLAGEFAAQACVGPTSLLDTVIADPAHYCRLPFGLPETGSRRTR
jgi:hypothetical protein